LLDPNDWLAETSEEPPCGPNLEYHPDFHALELVAAGKPEQQYGDTLIRAEEPDWGDVRARAEALFLRTKDLRVAVLLTRGLVHTEQFAGLAVGLHLIEAMVERYWDQLHPLDEDGDPTLRQNALLALVHPTALLQDVRDSWFVASRKHGRLTVREVEGALGRSGGQGDGVGLTAEQVRLLLKEVANEDASFILTVAETAQRVTSLHRLLIAKLGSERATDLRPLAAIVNLLQQACPPLPAAETAREGIEGSIGAGGAAEGVRPALAVSGEIRNRQDAILMLERVCEYLEHNEPTNPAPLLIHRAKRLMMMSFVDIVRDLAPDGVPQVERIIGSFGE
jgi:type VI secretion system protein ImpA